MFRETMERLTPEQMEPYKKKAADLLKVPVESIRSHQWDEIFPNTGGPSRKRGGIVGHAFSWFEILGFESQETEAKVKCSYRGEEVWDLWDGNPDKSSWNSKNPFEQ